MSVPHRGQRWVWAGRVVAVPVLGALVVYLVRVGLDNADKLASCLGLVVAVVALLAPYLLPLARGPMSDPDRVEDAGAATATAGGQANTGVQTTGDAGPAQVSRSGDARADGPGSNANTGIQRR